MRELTSGLNHWAVRSLSACLAGTLLAMVAVTLWSSQVGGAQFTAAFDGPSATQSAVDLAGNYSPANSGAVPLHQAGFPPCAAAQPVAAKGCTSCSPCRARKSRPCSKSAAKRTSSSDTVIIAPAGSTVITTTTGGTTVVADPNKPLDAAAELKRGIDLNNAGQMQAAIAVWQRALAKFPTDAELKKRIANVQKEMSLIAQGSSQRSSDAASSQRIWSDLRAAQSALDPAQRAAVTGVGNAGVGGAGAGSSAGMGFGSGMSGMPRSMGPNSGSSMGSPGPMGSPGMSGAPGGPGMTGGRRP